MPWVPSGTDWRLLNMSSRSLTLTFAQIWQGLCPVEHWWFVNHRTCHLMFSYSLPCSLAQLCLTLCDLMVYSPPGSSVHGIFQARILEMVVMPSSRGSSQPRNQKPRSPTLRVDSLPSESPEKPVEAYNITRGSALTRFAGGSVPTSMRFSWGSDVKSQLKKAGGQGNFLEGEVGEWFANIILLSSTGGLTKLKDCMVSCPVALRFVLFMSHRGGCSFVGSAKQTTIKWLKSAHWG